jgi:hypothetical protein
LQTDLKRLREWAFENKIIINPTKSKANCFTRALEMEPLNYSLRDIIILEASSCKNIGIILSSDLSWTDQVLQPGWHFISQCVFLKRESVTQKFTHH